MGVTIDEALTFREHVNKVTSKIRNVFQKLRRITAHIIGASSMVVEAMKITYKRAVIPVVNLCGGDMGT